MFIFLGIFSRLLIFSIAISTSFLGMANAALLKKQDVLHRDQGPSSASCNYFVQNPTAIYDQYADSEDLRKDFRVHINELKESETAESLLSRKSKDKGVSDPTKCYLQKHSGKLKNFEYYLSFLEFDKKGKLREPDQFHDLESHLRKNQKHVVLAYVHGWRHDAQVGNKDVRRFNMMLAYTRRNMEYRCRSIGRFCDHKLTGIYVGWPGRTKADNCLTIICAPALALSLSRRKKTSEKISSYVFSHLQEIETQLGSRQTFDEKPWNRNVFVTMGHSLGGNLLANAVKTTTIEQLRKHQVGEKIQSPLGDLVVLFNPASDAKNWVSIQKVVREINGIENSLLNLGNNTEAIKVHKRFPDTQPPVYMAISAPCTSARYVSKEEKNEYYNKENCDRAVAQLFQINQVIRSGKVRNRDRLAIGHYEPDGTCAKDSKLVKLGCPIKHKSKPEYYGVTHEIGIQCDDKLPGKVCETPASLYHALSNEVQLGSINDIAACAIGDGWLYNARIWQKPRVTSKNKVSTTKWNSALDETGKLLLNEHRTINRIHPKRPIYAHFSHSIYRQAGRFDITSGNDPFWNVRASSASVISHGGFSNVKLLCSINQIFLDQIADPNLQ
ncbi:MAG: hypothetical protein ABJN04_11180 [Hyphomicrobiales bacterium]